MVCRKEENNMDMSISLKQRLWGKLRAFSYRVLVYFLSFLQVIYAMPVEAMEAMAKEGTVLVSPQNARSAEPGFSILQISPNKEGSYSLALDPDLWRTEKPLVFLDGEKPVGMVSSEKGHLQFIGGQAPIVLDGRFSTKPESNKENQQSTFFDNSGGESFAQAYGPLTFVTKGSLTVLGGTFSQEATFDAESLSLDGDIASYAPWKGWSRKGDLNLDGTFRGLSDLMLKSKRINNNQSTWAQSIHLDFQEGRNGQKGDFKAEEDVLLGVSLFEPTGEDRPGFRSFINNGAMRSKRIVQLCGDHFEGEKNSRIFAGVLHRFQGGKYSNLGNLYTPNISLIQSNSAYFGNEFVFDGDRFFTLTKTRLETDAVPGRSAAKITAASKIMLDSQSTLVHKGNIILRKVAESQLPYDQYGVGPSLDTTEKQGIEAPLPYQINEYKKKMDLLNLLKGNGVFLSAPSLRQEGRISSYTGEMKFHGKNILVSGSTHLVDHFQHNRIDIQGIDAVLNGILEGGYLTSINLENHLELSGQELSTKNLQTRSNTAAVAGPINADGARIEALTRLTQESTSRFTVKDALLRSGGFLKADGVNTIENCLTLQAPELLHMGLTQALQFFLLGENVNLSGEVLARLIQGQAENTFSHNAQTTASHVEFQGRTVDLHKLINTDSLDATATNSLQTDATIRNAKKVTLAGENSMAVAGSLEQCGAVDIKTQGHGSLAGLIQSQSLDVQGQDLGTSGHNDVSEHLRITAQGNLNSSSDDTAGLLQYSAGKDTHLSGNKAGGNLVSVSQGSANIAANMNLTGSAYLQGNESLAVSEHIKAGETVSLNSNEAASTSAMIEAKNLGVQGFDAKMTGQNTIAANLEVNVRHNLENVGTDKAPNQHYSAGHNATLAGKKESSTFSAIAQNDLEFAAHLKNEGTALLKGDGSATIGGEIDSKGDTFIESHGDVDVPANIKSNNLAVQGRDVKASGETEIKGHLIANASRDLDLIGKDRADRIQATAGQDMTIAGTKKGASLAAAASGHLKSTANAEMSDKLHMEGAKSLDVAGKIVAPESTTFQTGGLADISAVIQTKNIGVEAEDADLSWKATAEKTTVVANQNIDHSGDTDSSDIALKSKTAHLGGTVKSAEFMTAQADEITTTWKADLNKLGVSADNLTLGGETKAKEASLNLQNTLYLKDFVDIQNLKVHAKHLVQEDTLKGGKASLEIDESVKFRGDVTFTESLVGKAKTMSLENAKVKVPVLGLITDQMTAKNSSLTADVTSIEVKEGNPDLRDLTVGAKEQFTLRAPTAQFDPSKISAGIIKLRLDKYENGIEGVKKLIDELVHCDTVCIDARELTLNINLPTIWHRNVALALYKVAINASLKNSGSIELVSETGIDVSDSVIGKSIHLQALKENIILDRALLEAFEDVSVIADEGDVNAKGSMIKGKTGNVAIAAGQDIFVTSLADREGDSQNYKDKKVQAGAEAGKKLDIFAGRNIGLTAVDTKSGTSTTLKAGQHIVDASLPLESQEVTHTKKKKKQSSTRDKFTEHEVSSHETGGGFDSTADGYQDLHAPKVKADGKVLIEGTQGVTIHDVNNNHEHESSSKEKRGALKGKKTKKTNSFDSRPQGADLSSKVSVNIDSDGDIAVTNIASHAPKTTLTALTGIVKILQGENHSSSSSMSSSKSVAWQKQQSRVEDHSTFSASQFDGKLEIKSRETIVQSVRGQTLDFMKQLQNHNGKLSYDVLEEFHHVKSQKTQGPTQALAAVVALAVTICTAGAGATLGGMVAGAGGLAASSTAGMVVSSMTAAAFTSVCSQAALALLSNQGDIGKAAKSLANGKTLKSLGISMVSAGLMTGIADVLSIPQTGIESTTLADQIQRQTLQLFVGSGLGIAAGQKPKEALEQGLRGAVSGTLGASFAKWIGETFQAGKIDSFSHKFLHALVGAGFGALTSDDAKKGAIAGAIGAATAEFLAEHLPDSMSARTRADLSKLGVSIGALFADLNVDAVIGAANNALENNFLLTHPEPTFDVMGAHEENGDEECYEITDGHFSIRVPKLGASLGSRTAEDDLGFFQGAWNWLGTDIEPLARAQSIWYNQAESLNQDLAEALKKPNLSFFQRCALQKAKSAAFEAMGNAQNMPTSRGGAILEGLLATPGAGKLASAPFKLLSPLRKMAFRVPTGGRNVSEALDLAGVGRGNKMTPFVLNHVQKRTVLTADKIFPSSRIISLEKPGRVVFDGVEFRAVRDLSHVSEDHLRKMYKVGANPHDVYGNKLSYHHLDQIPQRQPGSAYVLIPQKKHNIWNKAQHPKGNAKGAGLTPAQRAESDKLVRDFNKAIAENELKRRGVL
jgi:hypothetical protein